MYGGPNPNQGDPDAKEYVGGGGIGQGSNNGQGGYMKGHGANYGKPQNNNYGCQQNGDNIGAPKPDFKDDGNADFGGQQYGDKYAVPKPDFDYNKNTGGNKKNNYGKSNDGVNYGKGLDLNFTGPKPSDGWDDNYGEP